MILRRTAADRASFRRCRCRRPTFAGDDGGSAIAISRHDAQRACGDAAGQGAFAASVCRRRRHAPHDAYAGRHARRYRARIEEFATDV